jgi:acyl carrier protein
MEFAVNRFGAAILGDFETMAATTIDRDAIAKKILGFLQEEIQDKTIVLTMDTPTDQVAIDSIDIVRVIFKIEEEFGSEIAFAPDAGHKSVGDVVFALIDLIPETAK